MKKKLLKQPVQKIPLSLLGDRAFASHTGDWGSIPSCDRPKSLKKVVSAPLPSAWQQVRVSRVLGDDHYKRMTRVTACVARLRTLTAL